MELVQGQKLELTKLTEAKQIEVELSLEAPAQTEVDVSCFGLDGAKKLSDDRYFIFYNQKTSPCGALKLEPQGEGRGRFSVDLSGVPTNIRRLVFVFTLDGPGAMKAAGAGSVRIRAGGTEVAAHTFVGKDLGDEKALMAAELYLKDPAPDTRWRFAIVGQGFAGGLKALLEHFGGEAVEEEAPPPPPPPKLNLGKITLDKRGDSQKLSLSKDGGAAKPIHINLNWQQKAKGGLGGFLGGNKATDLDLGCFWELKSGEKGVIQPLGNRFGSKAMAPYIFLDQDDRSGASAQGENMYLHRPDTLKRCVVFAMIYEGSRNFTEVGGRVTLDDGKGSEITVHMDAPDPRQTFCAVCLIEADGAGLRIQKEERYFGGHPDCDEHYGFGFRWVAGQK